MPNVSSRDTSAVEPYYGKEGENAGTFSGSARAFVRFVGRYPGQLACSIAAMFTATAATLAGPRLIGYIIDKALVPRDATWLYRLVLLFALLEVIRLSASATQAALFGRLGQRLIHDLRVALVDHMLRLRSSTLDQLSLGQLISRLTNDTTALAQVFTSGVATIVEKLLVVTGIIAVLLALNLTLTMTALAFIPLLALGAWYTSGLLYRYNVRTRRVTGAVTAFLSESLEGLAVVRLFDRGDQQARRFDIVNETLAHAQQRPVFVNALFHPGMTVINAITVGLLMWVGGAMVREGRLEIGVLIAFISYVLWLFWPVIHIVNQWNVLVAGMASAERVFEVLRWPVEPREPSRVQSEKLRGEIRFENVWFAYRNEDWVLKDLSFSIAAGERIGVVGATGSGKSTLLALLFRFYEPQKGTIYLDGVPLSAWPLEELRRQIALIQQDGALFEGTAGQNISLFASPELSDEPGLSADVSDRAVAELSAGERQWVAFLRAARRHPTVWFLDEAAAHLDPALDAELHQMVTARAERSTVIIVAHRLSSVRELDRIIVLHHGRIVESGPHGELVGQNGLYARMVALQEAVLEERP